jgi:hypothetical protein
MAGLELGNRVGQHARIVLQVGVHHRNQGGRRSEHAFDARRGQTSPADAMDAAHPRARTRELARPRGGAVGRVDDDEHDLLALAVEDGIETSDQFADIVDLVERRYDDAYRGRRHDRCTQPAMWNAVESRRSPSGPNSP